MFGLLIAAAVLILDVLSILDVFNSGKDSEKKAIWIVIILLLPLAGPLLYYVLTRRGPLSGHGALK
jgi:phospholipase D-like protein